MKSLPPIAEMERAYLRRDAAYNGIFYIGVRTTGIFCRPICPARSPLPQNVEYFATPADALFVGYRPCKRCRPLELVNQPAWAQELLADVERNPNQRITENVLRQRGLEPTTVRRHFQRHYGMTFQAFARARRLADAFTRIKAGETLDKAASQSGYESESGFRAAFAKLFGGPPKKTARQDCIHLAWLNSPLGPMVAGAISTGICLLEFTDRRMLESQFQLLQRRLPLPLLPATNDLLQQLQKELEEYFLGQRQRFTLPLTFPGTPFQEQVWQALLQIPYGQTRTYQEMASAIASATAVRAVGRANGLNRIGILIPCHRVVNKNGHLGGYGGGLRRKPFLLHLEQKYARCAEPVAPVRSIDPQLAS